MRVRASRAVAPTRIDLAGGTLDIWPICHLVEDAVTVNLAIGLEATAVVTPRRDDRLVVRSADRGRRVTLPLPLRGRPRGPLSWLVRLAHAFAPGVPLTLDVRAEAPAGAGLGGSSALGIAVAAALARAVGTSPSRSDLLRRVQNLETEEIRVPTGNQDYLAALWGGLSAFWHRPEGVAREALPHGAALSERLVLAYTGQPRQSGFSNWDMFKRFVEGERTTVARMGEIARLARTMRDALAAGELDDAGRLLGEEGRLRYRLAPSVATPTLRRIGEAARRAGAVGSKVCGAGGGGCLFCYGPPTARAAIADALAQGGARILDYRIETEGLRVG